MSDTFQEIVDLVDEGQVRISLHGYDELAADNIFVHDIMNGMSQAKLVEDYPEYHRGPAILVLQYDDAGNPVHIVWGIPKGKTAPAVLVTAYRPDRDRWSEDFLRRKS